MKEKQQRFRNTLQLQCNDKSKKINHGNHQPVQKLPLNHDMLEAEPYWDHPKEDVI